MPSRLGLYAVLYGESRDRQHDAEAERTKPWNSEQLRWKPETRCRVTPMPILVASVQPPRKMP